METLHKKQKSEFTKKKTANILWFYYLIERKCTEKCSFPWITQLHIFAEHNVMSRELIVY